MTEHRGGRRPARAPSWRAAVIACLIAAIVVAAAAWLLLGRGPGTTAGNGAEPYSPRPSTGVAGLVAGPSPRAERPEACAPDEASEAAAATPVEEVRDIDLSAVGVRQPATLSYLPDSRALLSAERDGDLALITLFGDRAGTFDATGGPMAAERLTYHPLMDEYLAWTPGDAFAAIVPATGAGRPMPDAARPLDLRGLPIESLASISVDPDSGDLYLVDGAGVTIRRVPFTAAHAGTPAAFDVRAACELTLALPDGDQLAALAIEPASARMFAVGTGAGEPSLYELDRNGRIVALHELAPLGLSAVSAMTVGPPSDPQDTDRLSLYLAGGAIVDPTGAGQIVELAIGTAAPGPAEYLSLVGASHASAWVPPSMDPAGITFDNARGSLVVIDPEIDELTPYAGRNVFFVDSTLTPIDGSVTTFTNEPSDVAYDPGTGDYFVSNDRDAMIFRIKPGQDGLLGGGDDQVSSFSTTPFGSEDPDGLSVGQGSLFVTDGASSTLYRITPGSDGEFTGAPPDGDDVVTGFDTRALGVPEPEGVAFDPARGTLYLVTARQNPHLIEVTTAGVVLRSIDLGLLPVSDPSGLALAPSSDDPARQSIYIVDRGIDASDEVGTDDGLLFEIRIETGEPNNPVRNGGFEADANFDNLPDGWALTGGQRVGATEAHSGDGALLLSAESGPVDARYELTAPSASGGDLDFSGWARSLPGSDGEVTVRISWRDAAGVTVQTERLARVVPGTDWVEMTGTSTLVSGAVEANLTIQLAAGVVVLDDIVLTAVP